MMHTNKILLSCVVLIVAMCLSPINTWAQGPANSIVNSASYETITLTPIGNGNWTKTTTTHLGGGGGTTTRTDNLTTNEVNVGLLSASLDPIVNTNQPITINNNRQANLFTQGVDDLKAKQASNEPGMGSKAFNFFFWLIYQLIYITGLVVGLLLYFSGLLIDFFFSAKQLASSSIVQNGWLFTRDTLNFVFILVLLAISFSTIAGLETLQMRKALPGLIFAALLVNFSLAIAGAFLQISNVMTTSIATSVLKGTKEENSRVGTALAKGLTSSSNVAQFYTYGPVDWLKGIKGLENVSILKLSGGKDAPTFDNISQKTWDEFLLLIVNSIIGLIMICIFAAAFIFLAALMAIRIVMLVILLILSPVPFVFSIIPKAKPWADKWWSNFINYVMFLPVATFFLALAIRLMDTKKSGGTTTLVSQFFKKGDEVEFLTSGLIGSIIDMVFISCFIFASLLVAKALGIAGSGAVLGAAKKTGMTAARIGTFPAVAAGKMAGHGAAKVGLMAADAAGTGIAKIPYAGGALRGARTAGRVAQRLYKGQESSDQLAEKEKALAGMSEDELRGAFKRGNVAAGMKLMGNDDLKKEEYAELSAKVPKSTEAYNKVQSAWKKKDPISAIIKDPARRSQLAAGNSIVFKDKEEADIKDAYRKMKGEDYHKLGKKDIEMAEAAGLKPHEIMNKAQLNAVSESTNQELQIEAQRLVKEMADDKEINPGRDTTVKWAEKIGMLDKEKQEPKSKLILPS